MLKNDPIMQPVHLQGHLVPGIWQYMLPREIFTWKIPDEREATCMSCPRIITDDYREDYRCCTYQPAVPNFALGFALRTETGRDCVQKIIKAGHVIPEGSLHTPQEWYAYLNLTGNQDFGSSEKVLCPLLDTSSGHCRIYAFRNSVCSTFFCSHNHGKRGLKFWERMQELAGQVEAVLMQWSLVENGFDLNRYFAEFNQLAIDMDTVGKPTGGWSKSALQKLWGDWYGREEELLIASSELIAANRNRLWEIANSFTLREADAYEKKQLELVPAELRSEIEESDMQEGEPATPADLWHDLEKSYHKLWLVPDKKLRLNKRVEINENPMDDKESIHFKDRPFELLFLNKKDPDTYDWRQYLRADQAFLLEQFTEPRKVNKKLLKILADHQINDPTNLIAEWLSRKVLVPAKKT